MMFPTSTVPARGIAKVLGWLRDPAHRKWVMVAITAAFVIATVVIVRHYRTEAVEARVDATIAETGVDTLARARRADDEATATVEATRRAIETKEDEHRVVTEEALKDNPDWANQPVPADVLGSLRD